MNAAGNKPGPHGENCECPPGEKEDMEVKERVIRNLASSIRAGMLHEKDQGARLSALVVAMAQEIVAYAHTGDKLVLDDVVHLRDEAIRRVTPAVVLQVLERIAKDHKSVGIISDDEGLDTL